MHPISTCAFLRVCCVSAGVAFFTAHAMASTTKSCDVRTFGAKPDGTTKNTQALQKAIDTCSAQQRSVVLTGGTYVSGPLLLKSHTTLVIESGSTLMGSPDHADYPQITELRSAALQPLLSATHAEDITLTGGGTIDGQGASWWKQARLEGDKGIVGTGYLRPRLIVFNYSHNIHMQNLTVKDSPFWQIVPYYSDQIVMEDLHILADPHSPNTDAIDPFSSTHVLIQRVTADVGDDNIAIKSGTINSPGPDKPSQYITIKDCTFLHGHGLSIGSEIAGGAQHITAEHIHFQGTDQGIRIKANRDRGNDVSDIQFRNITMQDVGTSILISEYYPKTLPPDGEAQSVPIGRLTPFFHHILIEDVQAVNSRKAGIIIGLPESHVKDVVLRNVDIQAKEGFHMGYASVTTDHFTVHVEQGAPILQSADVTLHDITQ